jgi:carboxypeptidase family protein/TonB-dependent receptor-like protein
MRCVVVNVSCAVVAATVLWVTPVAAQVTTGNIVGTVRDNSAAVLPGVTITVRGERIMGSRTTTTDEKGVFGLQAIPPGDCEMTFELQSFATVKRTAVRVQLGQTVEENVVMSIATVSESVTVQASAAVVDTQTSKVTTTYDKDWFDKGPIQRRSFTDVLSAAPGVDPVGGTTGNQLTSFGSMEDQNKYQLDGIDVSDTFNGQPSTLVRPNTDIFEQAEILSLGAPAEYGGVQGAVFNLVTRQGTNKYHGSAAYYFQGNGLTGRNTTPDQDNDLPFHRVKYHDVSTQLGGPIKKDRVWFFGAYRFVEDDSAIQIAPQFAAVNKTHDYFFKPNIQLTAKHSLQGTFNFQKRTVVDGLLPTQSPETLEGTARRVIAPSAAYTGILSNSTVVEVRYAGFYVKHNAGTGNPAGGQQIATRFENRDTGGITGAIFGWYEYHANRTTVTGKGSHHATGFLGGSHDFKFGLQFNDAPSTGLYAINDRVYTSSVGNVQSGYGYVYTPYKYGGTATTTGGFVDDSALIGDRVTLNLGVRYDHTHTRSFDEPELNKLGQPTGKNFQGLEYFTWNNLSPRLGFNYKLTADGKTVLKMHYGRYYPGGVTGAFATSVPSISPVFFGNWNFAGNAFEDVELASGANNKVFSADQKPPKTDQYVVGIEREIVNTVTLSATFLHKRSRDLPGWLDTGGTYEPFTYVDNLGQNATGQSLTLFELVSPLADRRLVFTTPPGTKSDVNAFSLAATKRMSHNWQLTTSAVFQRATGDNVEGTSATLNFREFGQNPNDYVNSNGLLGRDRFFTFKTQFLYTALPGGLAASASYFHATGYPMVRKVFVPATGLSQSIMMEPRSDGKRFPSVNELDARVQKEFALSKGARASVFVDFFNLTNDASYQQNLSDIGTSSNYAKPNGTSFALPRRAMLGAKLDF